MKNEYPNAYIYVDAKTPGETRIILTPGAALVNAILFTWLGALLAIAIWGL